MSSKKKSKTSASDTLRLKPMCALLLPILSAYQIDAYAADSSASMQVAQVEFDTQFLSDKGGYIPDLSRFEKGMVVMPGMFVVDIYVNNLRNGRKNVSFKAEVAGEPAQACFDMKMLEQVGVDRRKLSLDTQEKLANPELCMPISEAVDGATADFDFGELRLNLSIPQVSLRNDATGYVSPEYWDEGVTAAMLNYNLNLYSTKPTEGAAQTNGYLGLNGGFNIGSWRFRHDGSFSWGSNNKSRYQSAATYIDRPIPQLTSKLTIGDTYTTGEMFDSTSFRGVRLSTDDRMLPNSLRGYAPTVRGVANTNAKVTVKQNGIILKEITVAPGAFEIDDLYATGYGGDLEVIVTEADGSVHISSVAFAAVPLSLRPGVDRYSVVAGAIRNLGLDSNPVFVQGTWQHGFTNFFTGYAGINAANGYTAGMLGGAFSTTVGAIGADLTQANTTIPGKGNYTGSSARISFSKSVQETGTNFSLAAYRYSTGGFYGLNEAVRERDLSGQNNSDYTVLRQRNRASISMGQKLGDKQGQLGITASTVDYWNRKGSDINYAASYSNNYKSISYGLSINRQRNAEGRTDTVYLASLSMPLGKDRSVNVSANLSRDSNGRNQARTALSGSTGENSNMSYGVSVNHASGGFGSSVTSGSANGTYNGSVANINGSIGSGSGYSQASFGASGAIVAHPGGVTLSQQLGETIGVVEAQDAEGASILNSPGARIGSNGYGVVPFLTPYSMNSVDIDPKGLSTDVELQMTSQQVAPYAGSVVILKYPTVSGRAALISARQANGEPLPFGVAVHDENGNEVGVVGQASKIFARGLLEKGELTVKWGDNASSICHIAYTLPIRKKGKSSHDYLQIEAACMPPATSFGEGSQVGSSELSVSLTMQ